VDRRAFLVVLFAAYGCSPNETPKTAAETSTPRRRPPRRRVASSQLPAWNLRDNPTATAPTMPALLFRNRLTELGCTKEPFGRTRAQSRRPLTSNTRMGRQKETVEGNLFAGRRHADDMRQRAEPGQRPARHVRDEGGLGVCFHYVQASETLNDGRKVTRSRAYEIPAGRTC
jgi:hypothetical protein